MSLLDVVKDSFGSARKLWDWKRSKELDEVKRKVLRHAERSQTRQKEAYWHTAERLLQHGVIEPEQLETAEKALQALTHEGYCEYQDGRYYLKGHTPTSPYG